MYIPESFLVAECATTILSPSLLMALCRERVPKATMELMRAIDIPEEIRELNVFFSRGIISKALKRSFLYLMKVYKKQALTQMIWLITVARAAPKGPSLKFPTRSMSIRILSTVERIRKIRGVNASPTALKDAARQLYSAEKTSPAIITEMYILASCDTFEGTFKIMSTGSMNMRHRADMATEKTKARGCFF